MNFFDTFNLDESHLSEEASVLIDDDFFVGDVVQVFASPPRKSQRQMNRAEQHPDLDSNALRVIEEVIIGAEIAVTTDLEKSKRFHGHVVQGKTRVQLRDILKIYNRYREELCIDTILDANLYTFLMDLDLVPEFDWWGKLDSVLNDPGSSTRELLLSTDIGEKEEEFAGNYYNMYTLGKYFQEWRSMAKIAEDGRVAKPLLSFSLCRWIRLSTIPIKVLFDSRREVFRSHGLPPRISDRFPLSDEGIKVSYKAIAVLDAWLMQKLFRTWSNHTSAIVRLRSKTMKKRRNDYFSEWQQLTLTEQFHRRILIPWGDRWKPFFTRFMFRKMFYRAAERKEVWKLQAKLLNEKRIKATAFNIWADIWDIKKRMTKFVNRWRNMGVLKSFDNWIAFVDEAKDHRQKIERNLKRMTNKSLADAFDGWYKVTYEQQEEDRKMKRVLGKMKQKSLYSAFNGWASNVYDIIHERKMMANFLKSWQQKSQLACFNQWYDMAQYWKEMRMMVMKHQAYRGRMIRKQHFYEWWREVRTSAKLRKYFKHKNWEHVVRIFDSWARKTKSTKTWHKMMDKARAKRRKFRLLRAWRLRTIQWKERRSLERISQNHKIQHDRFCAIHAWRHFSEAHRSKRQQRSMAAKFLEKSRFKRGFRALLNNIFVSRRLRTFYLRGAIAQQRQTVIYTFRVWFYAHRQLHAEREYVMSMCKKHQAVKRLLDYRNTRRAARRAEGCTKNIIRRNICSKILRAWRKITVRHLGFKSEVLSLNIYLCQRTMSRAVVFWNKFAQCRIEAKKKKKIAQKHLCMQLIKHAFRNWKLGAQIELTNFRIDTYRSKVLLGSMFEYWKRDYGKSLWMKNKQNKFDHFKRFQAIKRWREKVQKRKETVLAKAHRTACLQFMLLQRKAKYMRACLHAWRDRLDQTRHLSACELILTQNHRRNILQTFLRAWFVWVQDDIRYGGGRQYGK